MEIIEKSISLNIRKNGNLLSQLKIDVIPKKQAIVEIIQGEGEGERYRLPANEMKFTKFLYLLGGVGLYSVVINRKVGRRVRKGIKKQKGLRRFGKWLIDEGCFRRIKSEEMEENIITLDDEIIVVSSESLFNKYFKSALPVGDLHEFK